MIPEGLKEILEKTKGCTWITGRSPRMGEGVCIRLTDEDLDYLIQVVNKDYGGNRMKAGLVAIVMCGTFYTIIWCLWRLLA